MKKQEVTRPTKKQLLEIANEVLHGEELKLFRFMFPQKGVLFVKGRPGTAKSAIFISMARKLNEALKPLGSGFIYKRMDLTTKDEVDVGLYPYLSESGNGGYKVVNHAVPDWAEETLNSPYFYLFMFEEPNRAKKDVRNAALGLWNERVIGHNFAFQDNVFMAGAGNMGQADGTDVEEFDTAEKSRMITVEWSMEGADGYVKWVDMWAKDNVHKDILEFLGKYPSHFHPPIKAAGTTAGQDPEASTHVCPRTWTNLSEAIIDLFGKDSTFADYGQWLTEAAKGYVGSYASELVNYLRDNQRITIQDLLEGDFTKEKNFNRLLGSDKRELRFELMTALKEYKLHKMADNKRKNVAALFKAAAQEGDDDAIIGMFRELTMQMYKQLQEEGVKEPKDASPTINATLEAIFENTAELKRKGFKLADEAEKRETKK